MKTNKIFSSIACAILAVSALVSCGHQEFDMVAEIDLARCLQPMNLNARVLSAYGDVVNFTWDVTKDADYYMLSIYTDSDYKTLYIPAEKIDPSNVPYQKKLVPDGTFYYAVQAFSDADGREPSKIAYYTKKISTYAVKDNLYLKVKERTSTSITLEWSKNVSDYLEVSRIEYGAPGFEEPEGQLNLTGDDIEAATAVISGLEAGKEYEFILYYLTAQRGRVNVWTQPSTDGLTPVAATDALKNALATPGARILLKMDGSPYEISTFELAGGVTIIGEGAADGSMPVVTGEFSVPDTWTAGNDSYFEGVEFSGFGTAANPSGFGFLFQKKNGGAENGLDLGNVTFKNCNIIGYTKGLFYEWGKTVKVGKFSFDSCLIDRNNEDGTVGGDGFDLRYESTFDEISFVNNTISNGFRTFFRNYPQTEGNPSASITKLTFNNNTVHNLCFIDNSNNTGIFGIRTKPGSFEMRNNLFLNMVEKSTFANSSKNLAMSDMNLVSSNNWFYGCVATFFNDYGKLNMVSGKELKEDPCYNAAGGYFNLLPDSEIAGEGIGASRWWTPYVEEPEDLTMTTIGAHTWDLTDARYFFGSIKKFMVRDAILIAGSEDRPIVAEDGVLKFGGAAVTDRKGMPQYNYLAFQVDKPGSVIIKAANPSDLTGHIVVGVGPKDGSVIAIKGGVSATADMTNAQKILITSITEESLVYIYPSGPIALEKLAWSEDVTPVNTALPTPQPAAAPASFTAGEATDVVVSWEAVEGAASYSVKFSGKTYYVNVEPWQYTIEGKTTGMLDPGSYQVEVFANPGKDDIYNTESAAGVASFAVLPAGGSSEGAELVVDSVDALNAAIAAGKEAITLAPGEYGIGTLTVTSPLALKGQPGAIVYGGIKLSGEVGRFSVDNIKFVGNQAGKSEFKADIFLELDNTGSSADEILITNTVIDSFAKSVIYASSTDNPLTFGDIIFRGVEVYGQGTGQGVFDLRSGVYGSFSLVESTVSGGRDFLRIDSACTIPSVIVRNNTLNNLNTSSNGNGVFYVRAAANEYKVEKNLILNITSNTISGKSGARVPKMIGNYYYNVKEDTFFTGIMDKETMLGGQGVLLTVNPVKNAAENDFTLVNAVVQSAGVGAPMWNPTVTPVSEGSSLTVTSADEFTAAIEAGKTDIRFAAGEQFDLSAETITLTAGMHLSGEDGASIKVKQIELAEGELGNLLIENLSIEGSGSNNLISVSAASVVNNLTVRNCNVSNIAKSAFYGNSAASSFQAVVFDDVMFTELGGGQGTFDIRQGAYGVVTIKNCTIVGGRDFIRADAGKVTGAVNIVNNTFDGVTKDNGNGVLYVRCTPEGYVFKNNLILNETGSTTKLSKDTGVTVPSTVANNFFFNCTSEAFWSGLVTEAIATANGGVVLPNPDGGSGYEPVKDSANHDYTLVSALCLSSKVGAARWNKSAGKVSSQIAVANVDELTAAIEAGKTVITLKAGQYDLTQSGAVSGIVELIAPLSLVGKGSVELVGGFKLGLGTTSFSADGITFNGKLTSESTPIGNVLEIAAATQMDRISITNCELKNYQKSLFYGNGTDSAIGLFDFQKNLVHDFGTGQGMIDIRKGEYSTISVMKNSFYNGGRDFIRCDANIAGSIAIMNNTFDACSVDAGNGLLWVRSCATATERYVVKDNLFLNIGNNSLLAKKGATVPTMSNNWFFNVGASFFDVAGEKAAITQEVATGNGGGILDADPCADSAAFNMLLTNADLRAANVGDPRWNSASGAYYVIKK